MSAFNEANRPQVGHRLGSISATATYLVLHASKLLRLKRASIVAKAAVSGTGTNHLSFKLKALSGAGTSRDLTSAVTTEGGVTAGAKLDLKVEDGLRVEKNETLVLDVVKAGSGAWADAFVSVDYQVGALD